MGIGLKQWASQVSKALRSLRFVDSESVQWERGSNGIQAHVREFRGAGMSRPMIWSEEGGSAYAGQFAVTPKAGSTTTVTVGAGRVIAGTSVTSKAATDVTLSGAAGTHYVYLEAYYTTSWQIGYAESTTYPTQSIKNVSGTDYPCFRKLVAEVPWSGTAISGTPVQQQFGEIHVAGRWT